MADLSPLEKYQRYLEANFEGGADRFFLPTGFLKKFQRSVDVEVQKRRDVVRVAKVDDAAKALEPAVVGCDGVFDLAAEPGSGKTSTLPFKFPSKRVVVVEPSPFDAWSAFNMATGVCGLKLKGLLLGPKDARVVYTDSYVGAQMVMDGGDDYDVMIVDECDSDRGVTKFLAEIKVKGKLLVRMSATVGDYGAIKTSSYRVEERVNMPDVRQGVAPLVAYISKNRMKRSLVLAPSAILASEIADGLPGSVLVSSASRLQDIADAVVDQTGKGLFVADDVCARGLNLNIDVMFDCQLVAEKGVMRPVTPSEAVQRVGRVGRNKPGWYHCPGVTPTDKLISLVDVVRHNVVRAVAGVPQDGAPAARVNPADVESLMCSPIEPHDVVMARLVDHADDAVSPSYPPSDFEEVFYEPSDARSSREKKTVVVPGWARVFGSPGKNYDQVYVSRTSRGVSGFSRKSRRNSSATSGGSSSSGGGSSYPSPPSGGVVTLGTGRSLATAEGAPYAVDRSRGVRAPEMPAVPVAPPVMDLTELTYDMDWPGVIRDRVMAGGDLPTIVPPGDWANTSATGMGTDWYNRLEAIAVSDPAFDKVEFEVVCRAWNKLVATRWVRRTPGLTKVDDQRLEFCVRYFQAYFQLDSV